VKVLYSRLRGSTPLSLFYPFGREGSRTSLGLVPDEVNVPRCLERGVPPHLYFYPFDREGNGASLGLVPDEVNVPRCLERRVPPHPCFYPFDREDNGASLGLVPDEVTVPECFGTNRKVYKYLGPKSLSLHHAHLSDFCRLGPEDTVSIDFEVARHFWRDPGVICVAMEIRETNPSPPLRLVGCFPTWPTFVGTAILNS